MCSVDLRINLCYHKPMNILLYRYGSICEPDMINTFNKTGLNVIEITEEISDKNILPSSRVKLVEEKLTTCNPLFVFTINFFPEISDICNIFKVPYLFWTVDSPVMELFHPSIKNECNKGFLFDLAQFEAVSKLAPEQVYHLPLASAVDRFDEVMSTICDDDITKFSCDISFVGSLYAEKDVLCKLIDTNSSLNPNNLSASDVHNKTTISDYIKGYIDAICAASMNVYGYYTVPLNITDNLVNKLKAYLGDDFYQPSKSLINTDDYYVSHRILGYHIAALERIRTISTLAKYFNVDLYTRSDVTSSGSLRCHGGVRTLDEMPKIFNLSKINLNMTIRPIETGLPLRCFDILGCGGFLMTNYQAELADMFKIGVDLEAYSSLDELVDKCQYYLTHEDERKKIAINGYNMVKDNYTYYHRVKAMVGTL